MRDLAVMIAVAMGTDRATAEGRIDAAYPAAPVPKAGDVIGARSELRADRRRTVEILGDGTERVVSDVAEEPAP